MKRIFLFIISICLMTVPDAFAANLHSSVQYTDIGSGKPIVLIHAFPTDKRLWEAQQTGLKDHFRIITIDLQGFGEAMQADGKAITMDDYAAQVKLMMEQLQLQQAVIGGESMGGYIALAFLQKYPSAVQGLILSNTQAIDDSPEMKQKREATAQDVLEHGTAKLLDGFMAKALSPDASSETKIYLRNIVDVQSATGIASALRGMALRQNSSNLLANTDTPILIITSDQDILISPEQSRDMHHLAKNSKLVTIQHAGHLSNLEQPTAWNQAVLDFF